MMTAFWDIVYLKLTELSAVRTASIIWAIMMEAVRTSETSVYSTRIYGATSEKAVIFIPAAVRTLNLTKLIRCLDS
jgi:hypothetical protein